MHKSPEETQRIDFLVVSDAKNIIPTSTLIYQIIELHNETPLRIYLIAPNKSEAKYFERILSAFNVDIKIIIFDSSKFNIPQELFVEKNGVSKIAYAKIFAPKMLPDEVKKVLYLDTDILLLRPLSDLYLMALDFSLAAAIDASDGLMGNLDDAFNSGVMLMNLEAMRKKWNEQSLVEIFVENLGSHWMDMTILRALYKSDWYELPTSFNFILNGHEQRYYPSESIAVVHFAGNPKPWLDKVDSVFFVIWNWLSKNALQTINREVIEGSQFQIFLKHWYLTLNEIYHQVHSNQIEFSWRRSRFELAGTQAELAGTQAELAGTQAELAGTQAELAGTQAELAGTQAELAGTQAELAAILNSRTWRLFNVYRKFRQLRH